MKMDTHKFENDSQIPGYPFLVPSSITDNLINYLG